MTKISKIKKRDGSIVPFDPEKIANAIFKAAESVGGTNKTLSKRLTEEITLILEEKFSKEIPDVEMIQDIVENILINKGHVKTAKSYIIYRHEHKSIRDEKKAVLGKISPSKKLNVNALTVLKERYLLKNMKGELIESPEDLFERIAKDISKSDKKYNKKADLKKIAQEFYDMMANLDFLPNSPTLMNAGTDIQQLAACFVLPIEDSMEGIFGTLRDAAIIHKSGGGTGFSFSRLRAKSSIVKSTKGVASGPVSFLTVYNAATEVIKQGGKRRGANMGILKIDHPDILEFINCKEKNESITNFNISVGLTEDFIKAVENDEEYDLINPADGSCVQKLNAQTVFNLLVSSAWRNGDPGIVFLDRINKDNPTPVVGEIESTNPCLAPDTLISTNNGLEKIKELYKKYKDKEIIILTDDRTITKKIKHNQREYYQNGVALRKAKIFKTGIKNILEIELKNGQTLKVTPDHKILSTKGWKEAKKLKQGEEVLIQSGKGFYPDSDKIGEELGLFMGWLSGDGWLTSDKKSIGMVFASNEEYIMKKMQKIAEKNKAGKGIFNKRENKTLQLLFKRKKFVELISSLDIQPKRAHKKRVPKTIFTSSEKTVTAYLNGLFCSDGTINFIDQAHRDIRLSSTSKELLKDTQLLLLNLGIFSNIYERTKKNQANFSYTTIKGEKRIYNSKPYFELIINGNNICKFKSVIGDLIHKEKNKKINKINRYSRKNTKFISKIKSINKDKKTEVYDISEKITNSLIANGIVVHNCGEQPLLPYEACNLGSINLGNFIQNQKIDWKRLKKIIHKSIHFLDNVIDRSKYPLPEITKMVNANRKVGLGVMGWADMLMQLGIAYNSEEGIKLAEEVMKFVKDESDKASTILAKERGVFPNWNDSIYNKESRYFQGTHIKLRNATRTTIAPTGTIGMIADASGGVEPLFALSYVKRVMDGKELFYIDKNFKKALQEHKIFSKSLMEKVINQGSIQHIDEIPEELKKTFVVAHDISPEYHLKMQAAFQKYTDNAVSKTVNFSNDSTMEDVEETYLLAYKLGCKGVTIYRDGSKDQQVLNLNINIEKEKEEKKKKEQKEKEQKEEDRDVCPECGSKLIFQEGCCKCSSCSYSVCNG